MEIVLASASGIEEKILDVNLDIDLITDFELSIDAGLWDGSLKKGKRLYVPGTEYGGIIKKIVSNTSDQTVTVNGYTWRSFLLNKVSEANVKYSGDLNTIINTVIGSSYGNIIKAVSTTAGKTATYTTEERMTHLDLLNAIMDSVNYKLKFVYDNIDSCCYVSAVPAVDYSSEIEMSEYGRIEVEITDNQMAVNHLYGVGISSDGEECIMHLYSNASGKISKTQTLTGIDEIIEVYECSYDPDDETKMYDSCYQRLYDIRPRKSMIASASDTTDVNVDIGDIVAGYDTITGMTATTKITNKILNIKDGLITVEYEVEE